MLQTILTDFFEIIFSNNILDNNLVQPQQNLIIYKNNILLKHLRKLQTIYPLTHQLLGEKIFTELATKYIKQYPSRSSNLNEYGEYFKDFIIIHPALRNFTYLQEIATVEWISHQLQFSSEHTHIPKQTSFDFKDYWQQNFSLHPASHLQKFRYALLPIIDLWKKKSLFNLYIDEEENYLLIVRPQFEVEIIKLTLAEFIFLQAIQRNDNSTLAMQQTLVIDPNVNIAEKIHDWLQHKILFITE